DLYLLYYSSRDHRDLHSFPTRRSSDLIRAADRQAAAGLEVPRPGGAGAPHDLDGAGDHRVRYRRGRSVRAGQGVALGGRQAHLRSEEHTSELQSLAYLVCRLLLEKKKK